jgi:hypothetical protein
MKTSPRKSTVLALVLCASAIAGLTAGNAQEATGTSSSSDSIVALAADSQSLPQVAATATPARGGTYWWVYPGGMAIPTPMLPLDFTASVYGITSNEFLVDLTGGTVTVTRFQLAAEAGTANPYAAAVTGQVQELMNLITFVQNPPATTTTATTETAMTAGARPMGGGFSPMYQSGIPYLTIAPTGTNGVYLVTVWNSQGPANYEIWTTPILANPSYPWTAIAAGTTGQTNFYINESTYYTGFYRAVWDTNSIPTWEAANNNPASGVLSVYIDSPTNGAVLQ